MELFLLSLFALALASEEEETVPGVPRLELKSLEPEDKQIKAMFFWNQIAERPVYRVVHWNQVQEAAWLCDRLVCSEGHATELTYVDDLWFNMSGVENQPSGEPRAIHNTREMETISPEPISTTLWCHHPDHVGPRGSTLPAYIQKTLERDW